MNYYAIPPGKDPRLWQLARRRASFKYHLATYVIINVLLWLLWLMSGGSFREPGPPWPLWPLMGWGIGVASHYVGAYATGGESTTEKEYEQLINEQQNKTII